ILAELGVVFLIFTVGLETPFEEMKRVGKTSLIVAILGVVVPFAAGYAIMAALGSPTIEGLFLGAALVATSVGITARVLADMGVLGRTEARIILGAAVIDDVLGLMVLTVVQALGQEGTLDPLRIVILLAQALIFVGLLMYFGGRLVRRVLGQNPLAERWEWASPKGPMFAIAVIVCLGLSAGAALIGLAAIIGAFLAGMAFAATESRHDLVERFEGIVQFLTPFFFGYIGLQVDLAVAASVWPLVVGVTIVALLTKVVGCGVGALALGKRSAFAVGVGMMPRGEVGIIVALIGLSMAAIPEGLYAVVVGMSLLTTLVTPPILVWAFKRLPGAAPAAPLAPAH
ncbi:MAG TPA: cation:proton antiporter, partial [Candidatus Thermoplasmatota archaeon]|nr:cation:proton antiporter [Candidatus Thermoplasmatota archaeon]